MAKLCSVKRSEVAYLELQPFEGAGLSEDVYNDAIVNIFTRLNTAGRVLTREEITFAWLKTGWDSQKTNGERADKCFRKVQEKLEVHGINIEIDELVRSVSYIWAVCFNDGNVLSNKDLLKGAVVKDMSKNLAIHWTQIADSIEQATQLVKNNGLEYGQGKQYNSLNSLVMIWCWYFFSIDWKKRHPLSATQSKNFLDKIDSIANEYLTRWFLCSRWSEMWAGSTDKALQPIIELLCECYRNLQTCKKHEDAISLLGKTLFDMVQKTTSKAADRVRTIQADERRRVADYNSYLWLWSRLDAKRFKNTQEVIQFGKAAPRVEVDHIVSVNLWENILKEKAEELKATDIKEDEAKEYINHLGNCTLLEKTFNISKGKESMQSFLVQIDKYRDDSTRLEWADSLNISDVLLDPKNATIKDILDAIDKRTKEIREEVVEFVHGKKKRADLKLS